LSFPKIQFAIPQQDAFVAARPIPFRLAVASRSALTASLLSSISIKLIKRITLNTSKYRNAYNVCIGSGNTGAIEQMDESRLRIMRGCVLGGKEGGEMSWSVVKDIYKVQVSF